MLRASMKRTLEQHIQVGQDIYHEAYISFQSCVYISHRSAHVWNSIGILFFALGQYMDAFDAFARSINLDLFDALTWRNLGSLVSPHPTHISINKIT